MPPTPPIRPHACWALVNMGGHVVYVADTRKQVMRHAVRVLGGKQLEPGDGGFGTEWQRLRRRWGVRAERAQVRARPGTW